MKKIALFLVCLGMIFAISTGTALAASTSYFLYGDGTDPDRYYDAEKSPSNSDDDELCWAATASNMLAWSGWGNTVSTSEDSIFSYFQTYWTDEGSNIKYGIEWWFTGVNGEAGSSGWSQLETVDGTTGGSFYTNEDFQLSYQHNYSDENALINIYNYLTEGYVVGLSINSKSKGGHAVTCWGVEIDDSTGDYLGVYLTDSDDNKNTEDAADILNYYKLSLSSGDQWFLDDFNDGSYFINEVHCLSAMAAVPLPGTVLLLTSGLATLAGLCRRRPERT